MKSLDALLQSTTESGAVLGAAVVILQDGKVVHAGGAGRTSVEEGGVGITPNTLFAYGSIAKTLCATVVMRLVERGLLDLDAPIRRTLPDLRFSDASRGERITLRHLLSHTSGLPMAGKSWGPRDPDSLRRFVHEQIPHYRFHSDPGALHLYSNTAICVAGHAAEAVTGQSYDDLVQELVFDPLRMARCTYDPTVAMTHPLALPHRRGPDGELETVHRMTRNASGHPSSFCYGSALDLAQLARAFLDGERNGSRPFLKSGPPKSRPFLNSGPTGGRPFLRAASIAEMQRSQGSRHVAAADHPITRAYQGYGLGFMVGEYKGFRVARHSGMTLSYDCFFDLFPEKRSGVVLLTNHGDEDALLELWATLCDTALGLPRRGVVLAPRPTALPSPDTAQLEAYAGAYLNVASGDLAEVAVVDGELVIERRGTAMPLVPFGKGRFYGLHSGTRHLPVVFLRDEEGRIAHLMAIGQPYHRIALDAPAAPDLDLWRSFEGAYRDPSNPNADETLTVRLQDGRLVIAKGDREAPCRAISDRGFVCDLGTIEFQRADAGEAMILLWGRATRYYALDERE